MTNPADPARLLQLAATHARDGRPEQARQLLREAAGMDARDPGLHRSMAQLAMQLQEPGVAMEQMRRAVVLSPGDPELRFQYACLLGHQRQPAAAVEQFRATVERQPGHAQAWQLLGATLQQLARHGEALAALRQAHRLAPDNPRVLEALAESEFHAGYPEDALPLWTALLAGRPDDPGVALRTAETLNRLGRHDEARGVLQQAHHRMPQAGDIWMALAQTEEDAGDRDAAREAYRAALALHPDWRSRSAACSAWTAARPTRPWSDRRKRCSPATPCPIRTAP